MDQFNPELTDDFSEYWKKTDEVILVPIKVKSHSATGTVFSFDKPKLSEVEQAYRQQEYIKTGLKLGKTPAEIQSLIAEMEG